MDSETNERIILLDGSATTPFGDDISRRIYEGPKGYKSIDVADTQRKIDGLNDVADIRHIMITRSAELELIKKLDILNSNLTYLRKRTSRKGHFTKTLKFKKTSWNERNPSVIIDDECAEGMELVRAYADSLHRALQSLTSFNPDEYFHGKRKHLYNIALEMANRIRESGMNHYEKIAESQNLKFGDTINTDNRLVASSVALSLDSPVILLTRDLPMQHKLKLVQGFIQQGAELRKRSGLDYIECKYNVYGMDIPVFKYLEERGWELV